MSTNQATGAVNTQAGAATRPNAAPAAEVVADEQLATLVKAAGGDVVEHGGSGAMRGDYEFHMNADTLRKLLAAPAAAIDAREQEADVQLWADMQPKDGELSERAIYRLWNDLEEGEVSEWERALSLVRHVRAAEHKNAASRSESPAARPNAAGQEQEAESAVSTCYSLDEENFTYEDLYEVLAALDDQDALVEGAVFYEGTATHPKPSTFFSVDQLFEGMSESAYDECGEWAEDFPDVSVEKKRELESIIKAWIDANVSLTFWIVRDARKVEVTAEMIAEHLAITAPATPPLEAVGSSGMTADKEGK